MGGWGAKIGCNFLSFEDTAISITDLKCALNREKMELTMYGAGMNALAATAHSVSGTLVKKVPILH